MTQMTRFISEIVRVTGNILGFGCILLGIWAIWSFMGLPVHDFVCPTEDSVWCIWFNDGTFYVNGGHD